MNPYYLIFGAVLTGGLGLIFGISSYSAAGAVLGWMAVATVYKK